MHVEERTMKTLSRLRSRVLGRCIPRGEEGAVMSEYVVLVGVVSLSLAASIAALGPVLFASYERARGIIICPIP
jgi:Flp pilus assembly pilin Flp